MQVPQNHGPNRPATDSPKNSMPRKQIAGKPKLYTQLIRKAGFLKLCEAEVATAWTEPSFFRTAVAKMVCDIRGQSKSRFVGA